MGAVSRAKRNPSISRASAGPEGASREGRFTRIRNRPAITAV